ncbi:FMN phosphatase YigB (HAD superfamily) [Flavobacterium sp. PL11]|uniref:HAD family hydrolase n=1 Tax=Flavobacterium sp. PL11 TaxID=3071717 RepID=UPI002E05D8A0|nr:FMN phosphatase YigB (HAD superfamily) [Flavobacterium sp. PL11]
MINTIIFDFGDIFINLDKQAAENAFKKLDVIEWNTDLRELNIQFETGKISREKFLSGIQRNIPNATIEEILAAWNSVLLDFPLYRLEFLQLLSTKYRLFLLSNTDAIHIDNFEQKNGISFYSDFYQCFEKVYFSFEIGLRKPDLEIFKHLISNHKLDPKRTLFVDDKKENTDAALTLGFKVWNLQVGKEDVIELLEKNTL